MKELREDFDRWWVTASFEEKISMGIMALIGASYITLMLSTLLAALRGPRERQSS